MDGLFATPIQWIDALSKIDMIGYPVKFGQTLAREIATPDDGSEISEGSFYFFLIFLMYPIIFYLFELTSASALILLPFYMVLYLIEPRFFVAGEHSDEDFENPSTIFEPRPSIPSVIAQLYAMAKLLIFKADYLTG